MQTIYTDTQCFKNYLLMVLNGEKIWLALVKYNNENADKGYILEANVEYPKNLCDSHHDLPFLKERLKIKMCCKLVCNL